MHDGLAQFHTGLGYLLFLLAIANAACALGGARNGGPLAHALRVGHSLGFLLVGRLTILFEFGLSLSDPAGVGAWPTWTAALLWAPVELVGLRWVKPEAQAAVECGNAGGRLVTGTLIQLVAVVGIFGLMSLQP